MTRSLRSPILADQVEPQLVTSPILQVALEEERTLRRLWSLVLSDLAGRPPWSDVVRRAITNHDLGVAARLIALLDSEAQQQGIEALAAAWRRTRDEMDREHARIASEIRTWEQGGFDTKEAVDFLNEATAEACKLPGGDLGDPIAQMRAFSRATWALSNDWLSEARDALQKLQLQRDRQREESRRSARALKSAISERIDELLESQLPTFFKELLKKRAAPLVLSAFEQYDVAALEKLKEGVERVAAEDAELVNILIAEDAAKAEVSASAQLVPTKPITAHPPAVDAGRAIPDEAPPPSEPHAGPAAVSPFAAPPLHNIAISAVSAQAPVQRKLSPLADTLMGRHKNVAPERVDLTALLSEVIDGWQQAELARHTAIAGGIVARRDGGLEIALPAALLGEAKSLLLGGDAAQAQALFAEALSAGLSGTRLPDVDRYRDTASWGVLVTLFVPYLDAEERRRTLDAVNLSMLFYRQIGDFPLRQVDDLNLLGALGAVLAGMEGVAADYFFREYVKPYLKDRPIAASELALGLFSTPQSSPTATFCVLSMLLRDVEDLAPAANRVDAVLQEVLSLQNLRAEDRWWEAAERLRRKIAGLQSDSEVLKKLEEAITLLQQKQRGKGAKGPRISTRLLTPEAQSTERPYVVIEVLNQSLVQPLRHLRVDAAVVDLAERIEQRARADSSLAAVAPEQHAEILVYVPEPASWPEPARLRVRFSTANLQGVRVYEESINEKFVLKQRAPEAPRSRKPNNPYAVGGAVPERSGIVGRKDEIERILRSLIGDKKDNIVVVLGERRMGKTTVLNAVEQEPEVRERYSERVVRIDVQDVPPGERASDFFLHRIVDPTVRKLTSVGVRVPIVREDFFAKSPYEAFKQFMVDLDASLVKTRVLIVIDELEKLLTVIEQEKQPSPQALGSEIMASLRAVMMQTRNLSFILSGVTDVLRRHTTQHANRLFRLGIEIEIKALPRDAAEELVEVPSKVAYDVLPATRDLIVSLTGRQPYLVQYLCHYLFEHMVRTGATVATRTDVERVIHRDILTSARLFQHFVEAVPDAIDAQIVQAIGALQRGDETVPVTAIARHLARGETKLSEDDISARLMRLRERTPAVVDDMIRLTRRFRLTVGLYARRLRLLQKDPHGLIVRST